MSYDTCRICGRKLEKDKTIICLNCGCSVCADDYDSTSGYCTDCVNDGPYGGC